MKISIVTATYNSGESLRDTLESVLSQTYDDYEHIIVDGGSTDNTLDILREYEPRYNGRLKWHSEPDRGIYDAMNKGIARATGELVGLLNSDDFYTSDDVLASIAESYKSGGWMPCMATCVMSIPTTSKRWCAVTAPHRSAAGRCASVSCLPIRHSTVAEVCICVSGCLTCALRLPLISSSC